VRAGIAGGPLEVIVVGDHRGHHRFIDAACTVTRGGLDEGELRAAADQRADRIEAAPTLTDRPAGCVDGAR
jgi:hypothetical protein